MFNNFLFAKNRGFCEMLWGKVSVANRRMLFAFWTTMTTNTHSENVTFFAMATRLRERVSLLRLYVHCLSCYFLKSG
jgi:hypothetical protein